MLGDIWLALNVINFKISTKRPTSFDHGSITSVRTVDFLGVSLHDCSPFVIVVVEVF